MNHLTNLYKHKCEQLQEQLNHLTRQLNEANVNNAPSNNTADIGSRFGRWFDDFGGGGDDFAAIMAARARALARLAKERAAREAAEAAAAALRRMEQELREIFHKLDPDKWAAQYGWLGPYERSIADRLFGARNPDGTFTFLTRYYNGSIVRISVFQGPDGVLQIVYWNPNTSTWTVFPHGLPVQGIGTNGPNGIIKWKSKGIEKDVNDDDDIDFGGRNTEPDPDGGGGDGGDGGGGIDPNNQSGLGTQY